MQLLLHVCFFSDSLEVCDETIAFGKTEVVTMKSNSSSSLAEAFGNRNIVIMKALNLKRTWKIITPSIT